MSACHACSKEELETRERQTLAVLRAIERRNPRTRSRRAAFRWRTEYQRDRDRVIHSRAFRRLEYKTQVFLNGTGDHLRTRLTHTIEVAAMARSIARALRLNEDLAEDHRAGARSWAFPLRPQGRGGLEQIDARTRRV